MSEQIEIEFKTALTQQEFQRVVAYYQEATCYTQTNYYFDTPDFALKQLGCGLRIRLFDDRGELTLKSPATIGLLETTDHLTLEQANHLLKQNQIKTDGFVAKKLAELTVPVKEVHCFADLTTTRHEIALPEGLLALDESTYGQTGHDYELELEVATSQTHLAFFTDFLERLDLPYRKTQNKIQRALAERQQHDDSNGQR